MNVEGRKSLVWLKSLWFERRSVVATLLAIGLGGAAAWAATGVFSVVAFLIADALSIVVQIGLGRFRPSLPWTFAPLLVIVVYWVQTGRLDWAAVWPTLILVAMWARYLPVETRFGNRGYLIPYGILLIGIPVSGIPVWCLLCLLPAPLALRAVAPADETLDVEWMTATGGLLVAGYVIKGLIR